MKKKLYLFLIILFILPIISCGEIYQDALEYKWNSQLKGWEVVGINPGMDLTTQETIIIPDSLVNYKDKVVKIGDSAFENTDFESIILGSNIVEIGSRAFKNSQVKNTPDFSNVTTIGDQAYFNTKIKSFIIPSTVLNIGYKAFSANDEIKDIFTIILKGIYRDKVDSIIPSKNKKIYFYDEDWVDNLNNNLIFDTKVYLDFDCYLNVVNGSKLKLSTILKDNKNNLLLNNVTYEIVKGNEFVELNKDELNFIKPTVNFDDIEIKATDTDNNLECIANFNTIYPKTLNIELLDFANTINLIEDRDIVLPNNYKLVPEAAKPAKWKFVDALDSKYVELSINENNQTIAKAIKTKKDIRLVLESNGIQSKYITINVYPTQILVNDNVASNKVIRVFSNTSISLSTTHTDKEVSWVSRNPAIVISDEDINKSSLNVKVDNLENNSSTVVGDILLFCDNKIYSTSIVVVNPNVPKLKVEDKLYTYNPQKLLYNENIDFVVKNNLKTEVVSIQAYETSNKVRLTYKGLEKVKEEVVDNYIVARFNLIKDLISNKEIPKKFRVICENNDLNILDTYSDFSFVDTYMIVELNDQKISYLDYVCDKDSYNLALVDKFGKIITDGVQWRIGDYNNSIIDENGNLKIKDRYLNIIATLDDSEYEINLNYVGDFNT